jgi:CYTH domain-containing protein
MPLEIERKFLVSDESWRGDWPQSTIRQGYLTTDDATTVRVRIDGERATLTVKGGSAGAVRSEYEYEIPVEHGREMLLLCRPPLIEKVRHRVLIDGLTWEIDVFTGDNAGLVVAEVELTHPRQPVTLPPWIGREVTEDVRYRNSYLARHPFRSWRPAAA